MTKEEIIKPENLVYKKPTLMNDNAMLKRVVLLIFGVAVSDGMELLL